MGASTLLFADYLAYCAPVRQREADRTYSTGVARQRADPASLGIAPGACTILNKLLRCPLSPSEGNEEFM